MNDQQTEKVQNGLAGALALTPNGNGAATLVSETVEDMRVREGLQQWNAMRAENEALKMERDRTNREHATETTRLNNYISKIDARNAELETQLTVARSSLDHYRLLAIEAKTHMHIVLGHVNAGCERLKELEPK